MKLYEGFDTDYMIVDGLMFPVLFLDGGRYCLDVTPVYSLED